MTIRSLIEGGTRCISFEYFPPRTEKGEVNLFKTIRAMKELGPGFVSITCGAGGSTRHRTVEWADRIQNEIGIEVVVHMTCLGMDRGELESEVGEVRERGLQNILALRGDPPLDDPSFAVRDGACRYAIDLVRLIGESYEDACVLSACHPEGHVDGAGRDADLQKLREKCDAGVDVLITQLFFDNRHYFDFVSRARDAGIEQPIVPGIMPVTNLLQVEKFTKMCGATIPASLLEKLQACGDDKEAVLSVGVDHATAQCRDLLAQGAPGIHFYTLNKSPATRLIVEAL